MPIKYDDKQVKRPNEELEYSLEQIEELDECSKDIWYFMKYVKIIHPDKGKIFFEPYDYQIELINKYFNNRFNIALCSRQSGKTTSVGVYSLWFSIFNKDKIVGIVSNKEASAKMILNRIKTMYEELPVWLKPGVTEYSKTFIAFDNGTRILISATSPDAFRGETLNLLIADEFAFVPAHDADAFWASNYPTISASQESKIIIISTPNGMFNLFHSLYVQAEGGNNNFIHTTVSWENVPGRDDEWAKEQIKNLGKTKFAQEFAVEFLGSTNTVIDTEVLKKLMNAWTEPLLYDLKNRLAIFEKPEENGVYVIGVDPSKGTGEANSAVQILKIESLSPIKLKQVAVFFDNTTDVYEFSDIVNRLSYYYNNGYIMCENNGEGSAVIARLWWEHENENLINTGSKTANLGIRALKGTKTKAVLLMKKIIEDWSIILYHRETIEELGSFIEENGKFFGKDKPHDMISALYWAVYFLEMNILDEKFDFRKKEMEDDMWGILTDVDEKEQDWSWLTKTGPLMS